MTENGTPTEIHPLDILDVAGLVMPDSISEAPALRQFRDQFLYLVDSLGLDIDAQKRLIEYLRQSKQRGFQKPSVLLNTHFVFMNIGKQSIYEIKEIVLRTKLPNEAV